MAEASPGDARLRAKRGGHLRSDAAARWNPGQQHLVQA